MIREYFPDQVTPIDDWFYDVSIPSLEEMGRQYLVTDYRIRDDGKVYTREFQELIDTVHRQGGGVIVVPKGTYLTGSLFFKQGVNLYIAEGGVLKGSDDISDYEIRLTRIEGESCRYFAGLINGEGLDGFTMWGPGTIDGNGLKSWKAFWLRRTWNPACTNKDEQRPRLVYLSNSRNVLVAGLHLQNSQFWTNHIYKSHHVKYLNCQIYSPAAPVKAPSTDALDIDGCSDVLVKNCRMEVNDDAVVLKGGKGPWADQAPENGSNERILVEDSDYGFCHGCLTCGSESVHNKNILIRRIRVSSGNNLLWLKMRPDTPQHYEYITVEKVSGRMKNFLNINPWTQFFDLKGREDIPLSRADHICMRNCDCECDTFFQVKKEESQYHLSEFVFENLRIQARVNGFDEEALEGTVMKDVLIEERKRRIFLAGDSTMQSYGASMAPMTGWGQVWYRSFRGHENCQIYHSRDSAFSQAASYELEKAVIDNRAMAGRSSRSFREEGRLEDMEACMSWGDYLLIQFAHNDSNRAKPERYVPVEEFGASLAPYLELCRRKGATPVLITAIAMRNCDDSPDGSFQISFPRYREAMMAYAEQEGVVLLDMGKATTEYCARVGGEACKKLFLWTEPGEYPESAYKEGTRDNAHLQKSGAEAFAKILTDLVKNYDADHRLDALKEMLE